MKRTNHGQDSCMGRKTPNIKMGKTMKLIALLLLTTILQANAGNIKRTVTLNLKKVRLETVLMEIRKQTKLDYLGEDKILKKSKKISIEVTEMTVEQVLDICCEKLGISYTVRDNTIYVASAPVQPPKKEQLTDTIEVTGKVINEKGEPIQGATVIIVETSFTTSTGADGKFRLTGIRKNTLIKIVHVAYATQEYVVDGNNYIQLQLKLSHGATEMPQVTIIHFGLSDQTKTLTVGPTPKIDTRTLNSKRTTSILQKLDNLVPGLLVTNTKEGDIKNSIRGVSTLTSNNAPLIVIDAFPYDGNINDINPDLVESISILKDASTTAQWGIQAGNGVIVIKTKSGQYNQRSSISVTAETFITEKTDLLKNRLFPASEYINLEKFLFAQGFYDDQLTNNYSYPLLSPVVELLAQKKAGTISDTEADAKINAMAAYNIRTDYLNYLLQKGVTQRYNINLAGGSNNINYFIAAGYDRNSSTYVGNQQGKASFMSKFNFKPMENLEIQTGLFYTAISNQENSPLETITPVSQGKVSLPPYSRLANNDGTYLPVPHGFRDAFTDTAGAGQLMDWKYRPLDEFKLVNNTFTSSDWVLFGLVKYKITPQFNIELRYQHEETVGRSKNYNGPNSYFTRNMVNYSTPAGMSSANSFVPFGAIVNRIYTGLQSNQFRVQLNGEAHLKNGHYLSGFAGIELRTLNTSVENNWLYGVSANGFSSQPVDNRAPFTNYFGFSDALPNNNQLGGIEINNISAYVVMLYSIFNKYIFSFSGRRDATNLAGMDANKKSKILWSGGVKWIISNEKYYHSTLFSELIVTADYGLSGNTNPSTTSELTIGNWLNNSNTNAVTYTVNTPANSNLAWETVKMANVALEFSIKNDLITGVFEKYWKRCDGLIVNVPADITTGYTSFPANEAGVNVIGTDISITAKLINRKFKWAATFLYSYNSDKVTRLQQPEASARDLAGSDGLPNPGVGRSVSSILSYKWGGLDPVTGDPQGYVGGKLTKNYDSIVNFTTVDQLINSGTVNPKIYGSLKNTVEWGPVSLTFVIAYRLNYYFRRNTLSYTALFDQWDQTAYAEYADRWQKPGDEKHTSVYSLVYPANAARDNYYKNSEAGVEPGDNVRIQNLSLQYYFKNGIWSKLPFKTTTIFFYVNNIGTVWKATNKNIDPDFVIKPPRTYALGINVTL